MNLDDIASRISREHIVACRIAAGKQKVESAGPGSKAKWKVTSPKGTVTYTDTKSGSKGKGKGEAKPKKKRDSRPVSDSVLKPSGGGDYDAKGERAIAVKKTLSTMGGVKGIGKNPEQDADRMVSGLLDAGMSPAHGRHFVQSLMKSWSSGVTDSNSMGARDKKETLDRIKGFQDAADKHDWGKSK